MQITIRFQNKDKLLFLQFANVSKFKYDSNTFLEYAFKNL